MDEFDILLDSNQDRSSINSAVNELQDTYQQTMPFTEIQKINGKCFLWSDLFIENVLFAFATDNLEQFSEEEKKAWFNFVAFQDYNSHSPLSTDCYTTAIGCTNPDERNNSFVVCSNGKPTTTKCQLPIGGVRREEIWASLDKAMMALYNCKEINKCGTDDTVEQLVPCPIT